MNRKLGPEARLQLRMEKGQPILDSIRKLLDQMGSKIQPTGKLGTAVTYLKNQWPNPSFARVTP